jgi:hypothetical protein
MHFLVPLILLAAPGYPGPDGTIGPLHIPVPPNEAAPDLGPGKRVTRKEWEATLTKAQLKYVRRFCTDEAAMYTPLCGATPLVAVFDDQRVQYRSAGDFEFTPGFAIRTVWPTVQTPWLARDLDGNGTVDNGSELLGSSTMLATGKRAGNGFEALAELDANHDGVFDTRDPAFASVVLWSDHNGDRLTTADELAPLSSRIDSISLRFVDEKHCDAQLNCERERSAMTWHDSSGASKRGAIVDIYLRHIRSDT